jgi:hypothetical protein
MDPHAAAAVSQLDRLLPGRFGPSPLHPDRLPRHVAVERRRRVG